MQDAVHLSPAKQALLEKYIRARRAQPIAREVGIPRRGPLATAPLSVAQQGLWFLDQLVPGTAAYNIPCTVRVRTGLDPWLLQQSINTIVQRHEALRTSFRVVDGQPQQIISTAMTVPLPVVELQCAPPSERETEAQRLATAEAARPFILTQGPLLRTTLLRLAPEDHLLLLTMHHIVSDQWSVGVFLRELSTLYAAFSCGEPPPLREVSIQFADFVLWQHERLRDPTLGRQIAYWRDKLDGAIGVLQLRPDRPRPALPTFAGAQYTLALPQALSSDLKDLSKVEGATLFMMLVASFQVLLHRYIGQDDMLVGSPFAGRNVPETEQLVGFLVNTLVLRADLADDPTFREYLKRVREVVIGASEHQDVPFERIVQALDPAREPNSNPLVQVVLALEPPLPSLPEGWTIENAHVANGTSKFDMTLEIEDHPEGLNCRFEYSTELFEPETIARLAGHWRQLLDAIVTDPSRRLSELPLLTADERQQILVNWNAAATYPADTCLHHLFEAQVECAPDAVAITAEDRHHTYAELNERANKLAHHLQRLGVGPEVPVALCLERSPDLVVAILATLKAGGYYVPLDPTYPTERLAFMLGDVEARVVLTQQPVWDRTLEARSPVKVVAIDRDWPEIAGQSSENVTSGVLADNLAYIIYTSGSTGKPKGVQVTHRNIARLFLATDEWYHFNANDVWTLFHSYAFDFSVWELWGALLYGGRLVVVPYMLSRSPLEFYELLCREQVTVLNQTPSAFRQLIVADESSDRAGELALRLVIFGGEALDPKGLRPWMDRHGDRRPLLVNMYGITETTVHVTYQPIVAADLDAMPGSVIGRPIPDLQVYVLDPHLQPVPIGVPGELYVGGAGLARGYVNRPNLTAARFIGHPFSCTPGERLYKTGDLVRFQSDGTLEYLGRIDDQVKIRGFRIELGEIQAALSEHSAVREAVVVACEDTSGDKRLVAYLVARPGLTPKSAELRGYLKARLPEYMVPSAFVMLDALPLTTNGKVDRRALPEPRVAEVGDAEPFVAPALPIHRQLVEIWEELLDVRPIGIADDFFDLGGHSLLAARMVDRVEQATGKRLPISRLIAGATIELLASALLDDAESAPKSPSVRTQAHWSRCPFFFLHGDYRGDPIWCLNLARDLGQEYPLVPVAPLDLGGGVPLSVEALAAAHVEAMRKVQPEGPYLLGGWCGGAVVAFEMAKQLHAHGQTVDLLVLMETGVVSPRERLVHSFVGTCGRLFGLGEDRQVGWFKSLLPVSLRLEQAAIYPYLCARYVRRRLKDGPSKGLAAIVRRGLTEAGTIARYSLRAVRPTVHGTKQGANHVAAHSPVPMSRHRQDYLEVFTWISANYEPGTYPGRVTLFWSHDRPLDGVDRRMGWRIAANAAEVDVHSLPGTHTTCRTEHVHDLGRRLRECLRTVQAANQSDPSSVHSSLASGPSGQT